jgi:HAMP domain-containing protein/GGDEF domain-containing protein
MNNSVAGKIALGAIILVFLAVALTSYAAISRQTSAMEAAEDRAADLLASGIVISSASDIVKGDIANLAPTVRRMQEQNPTLLWIAIYDVEARRLAAMPEVMNQVSPGATRFLERPIRMHGQDFGKIQMVFDREPIEAARREILGGTLALAAILMVLALLGSLIWAHRFAAPIVRLAEAAEKVAAGDLTVSVAVARADEVGRLGHRFNEMVSRLAASRAEIEHALNELSTLYSVSRIINSTSDRNEILKLNIETLATGFGFTRIVILLEINRAWRVAASSQDAVAAGAEVSLEEIGLVETVGAEAPVAIDAARLPSAWGFAGTSPSLVYAVPLRTGANTVGILLAGGQGVHDADAVQTLSVVSSQIAPPILISIMTEREMQKLTNPFEFIAKRINLTLEKARRYGLPLTLLSFRLDPAAWKDGALAVERIFTEVGEAVKSKLPECELVVRYGANRLLVVAPGISRAEARAALMNLDLPHLDRLETAAVSSPEDGDSAQDLLATMELGRRS